MRPWDVEFNCYHAHSSGLLSNNQEKIDTHFSPRKCTRVEFAYVKHLLPSMEPRASDLWSSSSSSVGGTRKTVAYEGRRGWLTVLHKNLASATFMHGAEYIWRCTKREMRSGGAIQTMGAMVCIEKNIRKEGDGWMDGWMDGWREGGRGEGGYPLNCCSFCVVLLVSILKRDNGTLALNKSLGIGLGGDSVSRFLENC